MLVQICELEHNLQVTFKLSALQIKYNRKYSGFTFKFQLQFHYRFYLKYLVEISFETFSLGIDSQVAFFHFI